MGVEGGKFPLNAINQAKRGLAVDGAPATDVKLKVFSARDTASLQDGQTRKTAGQRHAQIGRRRLDKPLGRNGRKGRNDTLFLLLSISDDYGFLQGIHPPAGTSSEYCPLRSDMVPCWESFTWITAPWRGSFCPSRTAPMTFTAAFWAEPGTLQSHSSKQLNRISLIFIKNSSEVANCRLLLNRFMQIYLF